MSRDHFLEGARMSRAEAGCRLVYNAEKWQNMKERDFGAEGGAQRNGEEKGGARWNRDGAVEQRLSDGGTTRDELQWERRLRAVAETSSAETAASSRCDGSADLTLCGGGERLL
ncbi:uncharacterized protein LOC110270862 [Arachis ipaensis]|uniref:uncharacterized protein LOC110270862 n=1 Tax=Arachis ipaensis TaxID=130454 RepID=UPI000A2B1029|nr:uncharacterized protein LOC110270862 [Arachis ipaensis]